MRFTPVLCMLLAAGCGAGCARPPERTKVSAAPRGAERPRTCAVEMHPFPVDEIVAPGKIELNPNRVSKVFPLAAGRVRRVLVKLGDAVREGQPLVIIESPEAGLALSAYAQAQALARQAATTLAKAQKDLARVRELNANKAAPLKDVAAAETEVELGGEALAAAQAASDEALHRLGMLGLDPAHHTHEISVNAPISGKVLEVLVAPGEVRNDTTAPLMTIADLSSVWVTSQVSENSIRLVTIDEAVDIELLAYPGERFRGRVRRVADTVDPETRTVKVQAELDNRQGRLRPEMFARIRHGHGTRQLPCVPANAVVHGGGATWVVREKDDGGFERVRVVTGEGSGGLVPILEGLKTGDRVVVEGAALMRQR